VGDVCRGLGIVGPGFEFREDQRVGRKRKERRRLGLENKGKSDHPRLGVLLSPCLAVSLKPVPGNRGPERALVLVATISQFEGVSGKRQEHEGRAWRGKPVLTEPPVA